MEYGINDKKELGQNKDSMPSVLIITSVDPTFSSGILAMDYYDAFKKQGYSCNILTKYPVKGNDAILSVYKSKRLTVNDFFCKVFRYVRQKLFKDVFPSGHKGGIGFFYKKETDPPVSVYKTMRVINKKYDFVLILFWQGLLSYRTIEAIYDKLEVPIFFLSVDYSPITGGCHFFGDCERYKIGCGCCPAWDSNDPTDFTHFNILYRQRVLDKVDPVILTNTYMNFFVKESYLFKGRKRASIFPIIDENLFCIRDKREIRKRLGIPEDKFVLYLACQNLSDPRKGISYLLEAFCLLHSRLNNEEQESLFVIIAGKNTEQIISEIPFSSKSMGFVSFQELPLIASAADLYLSPSIHDAGPMMINQSLSCGVPVVAFEMGVALDVVKNQGTGYCAMMKDVFDFARGIESIFRMDKDTYQQMCKRCREVALMTTSCNVSIENIINIYNNYQSADRS